MSATWMRAVAEQASEVRGTPMVVLLCLAWHANDDGLAWPSQATIAEWAHVGIRQVERVLDGLVALGRVTREPRPGKSSMYRLHAEPLTSDVTPDIPDPRHLMSPLTSDPPPTSDVVQPLTSDVVQKHIENKNLPPPLVTTPLSDVTAAVPEPPQWVKDIEWMTPSRWRRAYRRAIHVDVTNVIEDMQEWCTDNHTPESMNLLTKFIDNAERKWVEDQRPTYEDRVAETVRRWNRERREQEERQEQGR